MELWSPLIWVIIIVALLIASLITTPEPPSTTHGTANTILDGVVEEFSMSTRVAPGCKIWGFPKTRDPNIVP